ncbi:DUF2024 family protein [Psychroserpens luteolus]|uniref:DUF2024 family protein n=1 Tax=Psychroserpens luteolus TaxID=2855840 RepID=UPI001E49069C|nr:DUF2024 family protein [Psychroserpens luteolus]MCD2259836.1 DUF2024 family protein [Psychroserpens luteolus]
MKVSVWDTYVKRDDGRIMHFDILVPSEVTDEVTVFNFGNEYLKRKSINNKVLSVKECRLCHIEQATQDIEHEILNKGYFIIEMEHCD